nr:ROK family transcriptional regulator [Spelaeicoccus albus]
MSTVLSLVHRRDASSRAELTRATGLNRSTTAALVNELAGRRLVETSAPDANARVGRPSPLVAANPDVVALAVNPEVDAVTVGVVGLDGTVHEVERHETAAIPAARDAVSIAADMIARLAFRRAGPKQGARRVVGVGVAVPGLVRESDGVVRLAPHLKWTDERFAAELAEATGLSVWAANDANLGANAEHLFGAGRGVTEMVYVNGGASGIGAGVISAASPLTGISGYAGELGHTLVNSGGRRCHCGAVGCLETEVSQRALLDVLGWKAADAGELEEALTGGKANGAVRREVDRQLASLAVALRNATNVFNPQLIVLGGFLRALVSAAPGRLDELVVAEALSVSAESVRIAPAELGTELLMIGAAELAFRALIADPAEWKG